MKLSTLQELYEGLCRLNDISYRADITLTECDIEMRPSAEMDDALHCIETFLLYIIGLGFNFYIKSEDNKPVMHIF